MCRVNMLIWDVVGGQKSTSLSKASSMSSEFGEISFKMIVTVHKFPLCFTRTINSVGISDTFFWSKKFNSVPCSTKLRRLRRVAQFISCPVHKSSREEGSYIVNTPKFTALVPNEKKASLSGANWFLDMGEYLRSFSNSLLVGGFSPTHLQNLAQNGNLPQIDGEH